MSDWDKLIPRPKSKFLQIKCPDCRTEQTVFSNVASLVKCNICNRILAEPTGGRTRIQGEVIDILD